LIKQEIKVLLMPQLCYQDAVTDLTANKNDLLRQTVSNHRSGLDFIGNMGILPFLAMSAKNMHMIFVTNALFNEALIPFCF